VLALPLFDAALVTVSRARRGVPISQGGSDHTSHRLVALGLPKWGAVVVLWAVQGVLAAITVACAAWGKDVTLASAAFLGVVGIVAFVALERVHRSASAP